MLYQVEFSSTISKNVVKVFMELYARIVCHGDVRVENILVRLNDSVVLDFERNIVNDCLCNEIPMICGREHRYELKMLEQSLVISPLNRGFLHHKMKPRFSTPLQDIFFITSDIFFA